MEDNGSEVNLNGLDKTIERIQKLLNMTEAKGCTEAEAITAMEIAQALLIKHNLQIEDVLADQSDNSLATEMMYDFHKVPGNFNWHKYLICNVAKYNLCHGIMKGFVPPSYKVVNGKRLDDSGYGVYIFGRRCNVEATKLMVSWISTQLEYLVNKAIREFEAKELIQGFGRQADYGYIRKQQFRNSFLWGAINRINERLCESRNHCLDNDPNTKALVMDLEAEAKAFQKQIMNAEEHSDQQRLDYNGYNKGKVAGNSVTFGSSQHIGQGKPLRLNNDWGDE